ncbi:MAG TPA: protein kinase [Acidobacteriota bacterium]|nr:protein kinase [Acidobacteriota bacterium]
MKSPQNDPLLKLAARISDGESVDWSEIEAMGLDPAQLRLARHLRTVAGIASTQERDAADSSPGQATAQRKWSHLIILERVGGGAYGQVLRAWDPQLEREVALKLLRLREDEEEEREQLQLIREARLLARLNDPNVATVYGAAVHHGQAGVWMEYVRGRTLQEIIEEQGPCSAGEAVVMGMEVCRAAAMVHKAGVVHRDIKAQNIIRGEGGRIVLTDFGSGYAIPRSGRGNDDFVVSGTPLYMAPEVLRGEQPTPQSDIYSIGVLLFFLLSDSFPVRGSDLREIRRGHREGVRQRISEMRPQLPHSVCRIVERALDPNPKKRFGSARQMEDALAAALTDSGLAIETARQPFFPPNITLGRLIGAAMAVLALLAMVLVLVSYFTSEAPPLRIIVEDLEPGFSEVEIDQIETQLSQILKRNRRFQLIPREDLSDELELVRKKDAALDEPVALTLLQRRFAELALAFDLEQIEGDYQLSLQAYAPHPLGHLAFNVDRVESRDQLASSVAELLPPLLAKLESRAGKFPKISYPPVTTDNFKALKLYKEAGQIMETSLEGALGKLLAAVSEDSDFASAYSDLALVQSALGDSKHSLKSISIAYDLRQRVTALEREIIAVHYFEMTGQHWNAIRRAHEAAASLEEHAHVFQPFLANDYNRLGYPQKAVDSLEKAIRLNPGGRYDYERRKAFMLVQADAYQESLDLIRRLRGEKPSDPYLFWSEGMARIAMYDFEAAEKALKDLQEGHYGEDKRVEDRLFYRTVGLFYRGQMALLRGRHSEAMELFDILLLQGRSFDNGFLSYQSDLRLAHLLFLKGRTDLALSTLRRLLDDDFPPMFHYMLRDAALLLGLWDRWEEAAPYIEKLREIDKNYSSELTQGYLNQLAGEDALYGNRLEEARNKIGPGNRSFDDILSLWSLARFYESEGDCEAAVSHYQRILSQRGRMIYWLWPDMRAIVSDRAVHCYEQLGKPDMVRALRQQLSEHWQPDHLGRRVVNRICDRPHQDTSR